MQIKKCVRSHYYFHCLGAQREREREREREMLLQWSPAYKQGRTITQHLECVLAGQIKPKIPRPAVGRVSLIVPESHGTKHACDNSWGNYVVSVPRKFPHGATAAAAFFPLFSPFVCLSQAEPIRFAHASQSVCARWVMVGGGAGWKIHRYFSSCDAGN
jgi:hypothetical protein